MTVIKFLSAGLIAAAMFTTPADAHGNFLARRDVIVKGNASAFSIGRWAHARIPTPHVGEFAMPPYGQPGGICDSGDNGRIC